MTDSKNSRLFSASCVALVVTALTFAIRANLMGVMGEEFALTQVEVGQAAAAAFWGFTLSMFIGGAVSDIIGLKAMYRLAFFTHIVGIILTIFSQGFWSLFASTLLVGIGNGFVESASYSLVTSIYSDRKTEKINSWHIWFPAGIVIGGILAYICNYFGADWRIQMALMIPPTLLYGFMFFNQALPVSERVRNGIGSKEMMRECLRPLFLFMLLCMVLTSATELGTNQWIAELLSSVGVPSILLLVFINGIMTIGRANAKYILKIISVKVLLLLSAIFSFAGLFWLGNTSGYTSFAAAGVFAVGICFFWPTMIGFVSEKIPKSGALGLSLMGGIGLLSTSLVLPIYGKVYQDKLNSSIAAHGVGTLETLRAALPGTKDGQLFSIVKFESGAQTLLAMSVIPGVLILAFCILLMLPQRPQKVVSDKPDLTYLS